MTQSGIDGYSYYISNDSDEDDVPLDSSDEEPLDEVNVFLHGTPEQKRKALKCLKGDEASSSDDEFEKVMQGELEAKVKAIENQWKEKNAKNEARVATSKSSQLDYYDDIYFDSDEEESSRGKKQKMTDEELLYDPSADEEDQKWVDMQKKRLEQKRNQKNKHDTKVPHGSDAILTCPACMTTLCMDCQRHSQYENQFRAMFVMNCEVKFGELLHYKERKKRQFQRHRKKGKNTKQGGSETASSSLEMAEPQSEPDNDKADGYHPVKCSTCSTEVAVYDSKEIYHFFNVLS